MNTSHRLTGKAPSVHATYGLTANKTVSATALIPTQDSRDIVAAPTKCLDAIWQDGHRFQKCGVMLGDFYSQGVAQLGLFDEYQPRSNSEQLMAVLNGINHSGKGRVLLAG